MTLYNAGVIVAGVFALFAYWRQKKEVIPMLGDFANRYNFSPNDYNMLAKMVWAESEGEPRSGQLAVAKVILSRIRHRNHPNTVHEVLHQRTTGGGYQFSPMMPSGRYHNAPVTPYFLDVVKESIRNYDKNKDIATFFWNPRDAKNDWIERNCPYLFTIGNHKFHRDPDRTNFWRW